jgi:SanA protein
MKRKIKKWSIATLGAFLLVVLMTLAINHNVTSSAATHIYNNTQDIPYKKVGLLLGTSKFTSNGYINLFYKYRIDAAIALYHAKKITFVLISGDNSKKSYNEPEQMMADLVAGGIPQDKIILDYAGFRTLDSIVRCKAVFGETNITIISQRFHNERALYLAQKNDIEAVAFNAKDVHRKAGLKVYVREYFARVKMMLDLIFVKEPKFYGPKIEIK